MERHTGSLTKVSETNDCQESNDMAWGDSRHDRGLSSYAFQCIRRGRERNTTGENIPVSVSDIGCRRVVAGRPRAATCSLAHRAWIAVWPDCGDRL